MRNSAYYFDEDKRVLVVYKMLTHIIQLSAYNFLFKMTFFLYFIEAWYLCKLHFEVSSRLNLLLMYFLSLIRFQHMLNIRWVCRNINLQFLFFFNFFTRQQSLHIVWCNGNWVHNNIVNIWAYLSLLSSPLLLVFFMLPLCLFL